jgi:23S rRNA (cytosine1962-C5)-methyltransferase
MPTRRRVRSFMPVGTRLIADAVLADDAAMSPEEGYELIDAGDGRRLERFGAGVVARPAPTAVMPRRAPDEEWRRASLRFERSSGWVGRPPDAWTVELEGIRLEVRPGSAGQLGVFPEHARFWPWLRDAVARRRSPDVLNLFAATGATTLALARAGAAVTHVDAARSAVVAARRNAQTSGLADRPIRWIVDDTTRYARREARRGRLYDGFVIDPPSYGHGPDGTRWEIATALGPLLETAREIAKPHAFVLLTSHSAGARPDELEAALRDAFGNAPQVTAEPIELVATSGAVLPLGVAARMIR